MTAPTSLLILMRTTPYGDQQARAAIDLALTAAAFELKVNCVLLDAAVLQLAGNQDTSANGQKNHLALLSALEIYDVEALYVHTPSADRFGISSASLPYFAQPLEDKQLQQLMAQADQVMVF